MYVQMPHYEKQLKTDTEILAKYFLRLLVKDQAGAFAKLSALFAEHNISFEKLSQQPLTKKEFAEVVIITHRTSRQAYQDVITKLKDSSIVYDINSSYRVEGE